MERKDWKLIAFGIVCCICLAGCGSASFLGAATSTPVPPTATPAPSATPSPSWRIVTHTGIPMASMNYAGFLNSQFGMGVGYDGGIMVTNDGGKNWESASNNSWCLFGLDIIDEKHAITCGNNMHVRTTLDGGQKWTAVTSWGNSEPDQCRYLSFLDAKTGWAASPSNLTSTTDGGLTWHDIVLAPDMSAILNISLRAPGQGYLMDKMGSLFGTRDGGQTWTKISSSFGSAMNFQEFVGLAPESAPNMTFRFLDDKNAIAVFRQRVYSPDNTATITMIASATHDGGLTWIRELLPEVDGNYLVYLSRDGKYLTLTDRTATDVIVLEHI
jgi:photosystem II stability/assembly factor-like uncharacterized protein